MKEIGGYFEIEKLHSNKGEYHTNCVALNTARNALVYVVRARNIKKVYIPYLLCDSVSQVCERENIKYEQYHTDKNFQPIFDKKLEDGEFLYVVNYYGQLSNEDILSLKSKYKHIIIDNTHAFFQEPIDGIDTIYSCRKFFGVPDGAYLATDCLLDEELDIDNSDNRTKHLYGRAKDGATAHYEEFKENDESFKQLPLIKMSDLTHQMLGNIDYNTIKQIRVNNYNILAKELDKTNRIRLSFPEGPFAYPYYCEKGSEIKKMLAKQGIFVPTLWPNVLKMDICIEKDYAENILPLPCDQRYCADDMKEILQRLLQCKKGSIYE